MAPRLLASPIPAHLIQLCPTMDLVAVATDDRTVEAFRFDGGRAFGCRRAPNLVPPGTNTDASSDLTALTWRSDGLFLTVTYADGLLELIDSKLGKVVQRVWEKQSSTDEVAPAVKDIHSVRMIISPEKLQSQKTENKVINVKARQQKSQVARTHRVPDRPTSWVGAQKKQTQEPVRDWDLGSNMEALTLDDVIGLAPDPRALAEIANLPRQLSSYNPEEDMPRLSPLPYASDNLIITWDADLFTKQTEIDRRFNPELEQLENNSSTVDITFASRADGSINTILYNSFSAGSIETSLQESSDLEVAAHPFSPTVAAFRKYQAESLQVSLSTLRPIPQSAQHLPVAINKTKSLEYLTEYILQAIVGLRSTWKSTIELPSRFLRNVNITLSEQSDEAGLVAHLYALAVTGNISNGAVREWLVDELGDHGLRRWEGALLSGYTTIISLIHGNLLPALDRASVVASRLRILARMPNVPVFDVQEAQLTRVIHVLDVLRTIAHAALAFAIAESQQARVFIAWMGYTITYLAQENPDSETAEENAEKAANIDMSLLLQYLEGALMKSHLNYFLSQKTADVARAERKPGTQQVKLQLLNQILERHRKTRAQPRDDVVDIPDLLNQGSWLQVEVATTVAAVKQGIVRGVRSGKAVTLKTPGKLLAVTMLSEEFRGHETMGVYALILLSKNSTASLVIERLCFDAHEAPHDDLPQFNSHQTLSIRLQAGYKVQDAQIVDDDVTALLVRSRDTSRLLVPCYSQRGRQVAGDEYTWTQASSSSSDERTGERGHVLPPALADGAVELDNDAMQALKVAEWAHPGGVGEFVPVRILGRRAAGDDREQGEMVFVVLEQDGRRWDVRRTEYV